MAQSFTATGDCPGAATLSAVINPLAVGQLYTGSSTGSGVIAAGPCSGVVTGLDVATPRGPATAADAYGNITMVPNLPVVGCGMFAQYLDQSTCTLSPVTNLPTQNWFKVGSYKINDGPNWTLNPPTQSGQSGCANLFGGVAEDYHSSDVSNVVNYKARLDGYADSTYCTTPQHESYKKADTYNCGSFGCSYSTYVIDHSCANTNYCWAQ